MGFPWQFFYSPRKKRKEITGRGSRILMDTSKLACRRDHNFHHTFPQWAFFSPQEWELLVLYRLQWEVCGITAMDFLDHVIPRLGLNLSESESTELRQRTETILALCATEYKFSFVPPSTQAASATLLAFLSLSSTPSDVKFLREVQLRLQTVTHTATVSYCVYL